MQDMKPGGDRVATVDAPDLDAVRRPLKTIAIGAWTVSWVKRSGKVRVVVVEADAARELWRAARQHVAVLWVAE